MRIGLSLAALTNRGGIGRYVRLLVRNLPELYPENTWIGYIPEFRQSEIEDVIKNEGIKGWEFISVPGGNRWKFETKELPKILITDPPDVFHGPDYLVPKSDCPVCVTVHDLAFRLHPGGMALKSRILFRTLAPGSINRASKSGVVFCDSKSTRSDLLKLKWMRQDKGKVVYLACEDEFKEPVPEDERYKVLDKYGIPENYVLYVGPIERRKNVGVLVDAYRLVGKVLKRRGEPVPPLISVGPPGAGGEKMIRNLTRSGDGLYHHLGYMDRQELRAVYAGCLLFCYPSRYEGFGLPPLEAMSAGKTVIVSNSTSLPEVVGDAGILVKPDDVQGWSSAILRILTNDDLRLESEKKSIEQSGKFSVEKMCREVVDGYKEAYKMQQSDDS